MILAGLAALAALALLASSGLFSGLEPSREQGREWAQRELTKPEYQEARPSLFQRAVDWLLDHLSRINGPSSPTASVGAVIVVAVLAAVVIWAVHRSGGLHRNARTQAGSALDDTTISAAEHAATADRARAGGDWNTAVVERFRAIVRELEERTILTAQRGRTADEIAAAAAGVAPALGARFAAAARAFDDVHYGGQDATAAQDDALRELAGQLRTLRPAALPITAGVPS